MLRLNGRNYADAMVRSPLLWGGAAALAFYALVHSKVIPGGLVQRYFTAHEVEYVATTMFFIGLAALVLKLVSIRTQRPALAQSPFRYREGHPCEIQECQEMLSRLGRLPQPRQGDYFVGRLRDALRHIQRQGSCHGLDEELKYLAQRDADRASAGYSLVNIIIWAIPILGFLGTVIGITVALHNLVPEKLEQSLPLVMSGLFVAFDTTTLALGLSIILMFAKFFVSEQEQALLGEVDHQVEGELLGRFREIAGCEDGQEAADEPVGGSHADTTRAVRKLADVVGRSADMMFQRQTDLWQASAVETAEQWAAMVQSTGEKLQEQLSVALAESLAAALREGLEAHARALAESTYRTTEQSRRQWERAVDTQLEATQSLTNLQAAMNKQAEMLQRAVGATGEVTQLEDTLNRNLARLANVGNFEQTVISLAAAVNLLGGRLGQVSKPDGPGGRRVQLDEDKNSPQAA